MTDTKTPQATIAQTRCVLGVNSLTKFTNTKKDKGATHKVCADHHAQDGVARVSKTLLPSCPELQAIQKHDTETRSIWYSFTQPWADGSAKLRIVSIKVLPKLKSVMAKREREREQLVKAFSLKYADALETAREELGALFNADDYPSVVEVTEKFTFAIHFQPLPDADDFRVALAKDEIDVLKKQVTAQVNTSIANAQRDAAERVVKAVSHMASKLAEYQPRDGDEKAKSIFRDSIVENVRAIAELLPDLNITADKRLEVLGDELVRDLCEHDADTLRRDADKRAAVAAKAKSVADKVSQWF